MFFEQSSKILISTGESCWSPPADVYRTNLGWIIKLDAAGIDVNEIDVTICGSCIEITGARRDQLIREFDECIHYSMEIAYTSFQKKIGLPCSVENCKFESTYRDGMFVIRLIEQTEALES